MSLERVVDAKVQGKQTAYHISTTLLAFEAQTLLSHVKPGMN